MFLPALAILLTQQRPRLTRRSGAFLVVANMSSPASLEIAEYYRRRARTFSVPSGQNSMSAQREHLGG